VRRNGRIWEDEEDKGIKWGGNNILPPATLRSTGRCFFCLWHQETYWWEGWGSIWVFHNFL